MLYAVALAALEEFAICLPPILPPATDIKVPLLATLQDIYRFSTLDSSLTGRLSSELLSRASLEEARYEAPCHSCPLFIATA